MEAIGAPQRRAALFMMASNTGATSVGDCDMTARISLVAVWRSSASVISALRVWSSLNNRTFSIAITAWSAKVLSSATCFSVNNPGVARVTEMTPIALPSRSIGACMIARNPSWSARCLSRVPTHSCAKVSETCTTSRFCIALVLSDLSSSSAVRFVSKVSKSGRVLAVDSR